VQPAAVLEFNSIEAIKQSAMIGMGVGVLPAAATVAEVSQGKLVVLPWRGKPISMVTQVVRHKQKWLSPALKAFLDVVKEGFASGRARLPKDRSIQPEA
jgi:DNA-binding transcriptional LysR family regulator